MVMCGSCLRCASLTFIPALLLHTTGTVQNDPQCGIYCALQEQGPLPEPEAAAICAAMLSAVAACHESGFCYSDLKPSNLMLRDLYPTTPHNGAPAPRPVVKLVDFGCSQLLVGSERLHNKTGTPLFMAPEMYTRNYTASVDGAPAAPVTLHVYFNFLNLNRPES